MVNILAADPSIGERAASRAAIKGMPGDPKVNADGVRRRFRKLKAKGQLPQEETDASRLARRVDEIRALYDQRDNRLKDMKKDLDNLERKAKSLHIDISPASLSTVIHGLEATREAMETLARSASDHAVAILLNSGITDREEAVSRVSQATSDLRTAEEYLELLRKIRQLRGALGIPSS
jgi:predicted nuclease with TOPRIM domain